MCQTRRGLDPGMTNPVGITKFHCIRQVSNHRRCSWTVSRLPQDHWSAFILWSLRHTTEHVRWEFNSLLVQNFNNFRRTHSTLSSTKKPSTNFIVTDKSVRRPHIPFLSDPFEYYPLIFSKIFDLVSLFQDLKLILNTNFQSTSVVYPAYLILFHTT